MKKDLYVEKIGRWREMGLDVTELEELLEKDPEHFKEVSKEFLKTHLNKVSVVRDKHPPENQLDGEVLALLSEIGKTTDELAGATGYSEEQVTLSLGRLISSGSAVRSENGELEKYCLVPPPAPPPMKKLRILPAENREEAEDRIYNAIAPSGSSREQILRATRLPDDQATKALASLSKNGRIRVIGKGKKAKFIPN
jgi:predicted Rossmann fold nucleotide-binding protein DprA/Smf involved in DNA uptake